jgi:hypothetical protein
MAFDGGRRSVLVARSRLPELTHAVFAPERPEVYEAYSAYECEPQRFTAAAQLDALMLGGRPDGKTYLDFAVWYPSCGGRVEKERIELQPEKCGGHTFRYSIGEWGIYRLQCDFGRDPLVECRIAVNSPKRAATWEAHDPEWLAVEAWNWPAVERHERRLLRKLRSLA